MKLKTVYICEQCGHTAPKPTGKCSACGAWNSFQEDVVAASTSSANLTPGTYARTAAGLSKSPSEPVPLLQADQSEERLTTGINELDRVLGGGIVPGSVILLSGEPGIGKSTLTLKICQTLAPKLSSILYISGEESPAQISRRARRMNVLSENISILGETNLENIMNSLRDQKPALIIVDSIQVMSSSEIPSFSGSINQTRACAETFMAYAKQTGVPVVIIGHVNKEGNLAGPKVLEHLVDTVLLIEGERVQNLRLLRSLKNRFGSTNEVGIFEMADDGMKEISNASRLFLEGRKEGSFGSAITATLEGTRPLLIEVQALVSLTPFGYPKRAASGFDLNRLQLLCAVIQKHLGINVSNQDVYINVVGGYRLNDPGADLAVVMAIVSSLLKVPLPAEAVLVGEVGLAAELRSVSHLAKRLDEAEKIGFTQAFIPRTKEKLKGFDAQNTDTQTPQKSSSSSSKPGKAGKLQVTQLADLLEAKNTMKQKQH